MALEGSRPMGGGEKWAVIIGVGQYEEARVLHPLPNAVRDAKALRDALVGAPDGFPAENVLLLTDDGADALHRPTRNTILTRLEGWASLAAPEDSFLVYFAGHGVEKDGRLWLMPLDARTGNIPVTSVAYQDFMAHLDACAAERAIVILDACHSGAGRTMFGMTRAMEEDIEKYSEGRITLASCKVDELSHEYDDVHGAFTWFLLEGLKGAADADGDGAVSALELSKYTFKKVQRWAARKGLKQTPRLISDISGDIVLAKVATPGTVIVEHRVLTPPSPTMAVAATTLRTGEVRTFAGIEMVWCPPGTFEMGSPSSEKDRRDNEAQHRVTLDKGFWMGKYQVTQAQWQAVMGGNPSRFKGNTLPVEMVSWNEAQAFIKNLNAKGDKGFRLPSEAEWEYASRAGAKTAYCFGDSKKELGEYAWYGANSEGKTHPVGTQKPNAWGLYDMHGNVWEWCQDWHGAYSADHVINPTGPESGEYRVLRGGSWFYSPGLCRAAYRYYFSPTFGSTSSGFGCCGLLSPLLCRTVALCSFAFYPF